VHDGTPLNTFVTS